MHIIDEPNSVLGVNVGACGASGIGTEQKIVCCNHIGDVCNGSWGSSIAHTCSGTTGSLLITAGYQAGCDCCRGVIFDLIFLHKFCVYGTIVILCYSNRIWIKTNALLLTSVVLHLVLPTSDSWYTASCQQKQKALNVLLLMNRLNWLWEKVLLLFTDSMKLSANWTAKTGVRQKQIFCVLVEFE